jgi:hypothetical protein
MMRKTISLGTTGFIGLAVCSSSLSASASSGLGFVINEVRIEQTSSDVDEFVEIRGTPGASLDGYTYIVIGDCDSFPPTQNGCIEAVVDLSGSSMSSSGYFVIAEKTFTLGTADLVASLNFEGNDNVTHLLVADFTGAMGDDLDTNDDGTLDIFPWSSVEDCMALLRNATPDGNSDEYYYCDEAIGPDGGFTPGYVYRCEDTGALVIGDFNVGVDETPGSANLDCGGGGGGDGIVRISEIRIDQSSTDVDEYFELTGDPNTSLDGISYVVIGGTGSDPAGKVEAVIPLDGYVIGSTGIFWAAEENTTLGTPDVSFTNEIDFQNGENVTHLLVRDCTASDNEDLDTDNDGVLDIVPWSEVIDSIGLVESFSTGFRIYSENTVGPDGSFVPGHSYRCSPEGDWTVGSFTVGETDTPGAENPACPVIVCGGSDALSCFEVRADPGCSDFSCCELVNAVDSSCGESAWDQNCVDIANQLCLSTNPAPDVALNEIRMKQGGDDNDEFFELTGKPGTNLDGVSLLVIGGTGTDPNGVVETAVNLSGYSINGNGFFVAAEATFTLGSADAILELNFNDTMNKTLLLVHNFMGTVNGDLDTDDDCSLDSAPWDAEIDGINWISGLDSNCTYATISAGPDGVFSPAHAYICDAGNNTWGVGTFGADDEAAADTPNADNPTDCDTTDCEDCVTQGLDAVACDLLQTYRSDCCGNWDASCDEFVSRNLVFDASAPLAVDVVEVRNDQISNDDDEFIELQTNPGAVLDGYSVIVIGDDTTTGSGKIETRIPLIGATADENGLVLIADSATFTLGTPTYDFAFDIENQDNITVAVVYGFGGDDLRPDIDTDDDGTIDVTPWVESTSCIAMLATDPAVEGDLVYCGDQIGPNDEGFAPGHVYFDCDLGEWVNGIFDPVGESDTPGELNNGCDGVVEECLGDFDLNGIVDGADLSTLLGAWGTIDSSIDLTGDGPIDGADLTVLLGAWGGC